MKQVCVYVSVGVLLAISVALWVSYGWLDRKIKKLWTKGESRDQKIEELETKVDGLVIEQRWDLDILKFDLAKQKLVMTEMPPRPKVKPLIMVIDDDQTFHDIFSLKFRHYFEIIDALSLEEGLYKLTEDVECILLDLRIPPRSGEEVIQTFRKNHPVAVAIVMSGISDDRLVEAAKKYRIEAYLSKDLIIANPGYVVQAINTAIARRRPAK